jgi:hypothetical protein
MPREPAWENKSMELEGKEWSSSKRGYENGEPAELGEPRSKWCRKNHCVKNKK